MSKGKQLQVSLKSYKTLKKWADIDIEKNGDGKWVSTSIDRMKDYIDLLESIKERGTIINTDQVCLERILQDLNSIRRDFISVKAAGIEAERCYNHMKTTFFKYVEDYIECRKTEFGEASPKVEVRKLATEHVMRESGLECMVRNLIRDWQIHSARKESSL